MSGKYMRIMDRKEAREIYDTDKYIGRTHGCSCCSSEEDIDLVGIREHIKKLEEELVKAKNIERDLENPGT